VYDIESLPADIDGDGQIALFFSVAGERTGIERLNAGTYHLGGEPGAFELIEGPRRELGIVGASVRVLAGPARISAYLRAIAGSCPGKRAR
jgi:hypothetical protein